MAPRELLARLRALFRRGRIERELDDELGFHIDMRARDLIAAGWSPEAARREARRRFGDLAEIKERSRDERGAGWMDVLARDLRHGARGLRRRPLVAGAAIVTLAV